MKKYFISAFVVVLFAGSSWFWYQQRQEKLEAQRQLTRLEMEAIQSWRDLIAGYQKRYELISSLAQRERTTELSQSLENFPKLSSRPTAGEIQGFDSYQTDLSSKAAKLIVTRQLASERSEALRKEIRDLEKVEHEIRRNRIRYHENLFAGNKLASKYRLKTLGLAAFPVESQIQGRRAR